MIPPVIRPAAPATTVELHTGPNLAAALPRLERFLLRDGPLVPLSRHPGWLPVLARGLHQTPYCLEAVDAGRTRGFLALVEVRSLLFGRFLVSLPYLNYGGPVADDESVASKMIARAAELADQLGVKYLEPCHEFPLAHPALGHIRTDKVHMRLDLPATPGTLWDNLDAKVRNQVRKGQKNNLTVTWGGQDQLRDFYTVFSRNMRDLGTPVYSKRLFAAVLDQFPERAELCVVRSGELPVASALLLHGWGVTEVPSASSVAQPQPHLCKHAHVLAPARASSAARPGRFRFWPQHRRKPDNALQETVGRLTCGFRMAVLSSPWRVGKIAQGKPALPNDDPALAASAGRSDAHARSLHRSRHPLSKSEIL